MIERISAAQFDEMEPVWSGLLRASRSDCLFLSWEWLHTWWKHFAGGRELDLLKVTSGGEVTGLLPLVHSPAAPTRFWPRSLEMMGTGNVGSDYLDFIVRAGHEDDVIAEVANYFESKHITIRLAQQDSQSAAAARLASVWRERQASFRETVTNVSPVIDLEGHTWESYLATLGAEHRYNFRRKLKHLIKRFDMRLSMVQTEQERRDALARLVSLHDLRRQTLGDSDAFHTPELLAFHEDITRLALKRGWLRLFTMWLGDEAVAALYGFFYNGVFYFYQSGFDPRFSGQSVGLVIMGMAIESAIIEGARQFDLLHGAERYKFHWARNVRQLVCLELYPHGARGSLWKAAHSWNGELRAMARKMLVSTRTGVGLVTQQWRERGRRICRA